MQTPLTRIEKNDTRKPALWKCWLLRFVVTAVIVYGAALMAMLAFGRKGSGSNPLPAHSVICALMPIAVIVAFALPLRRKDTLALAFLAVPLLHVASC